MIYFKVKANADQKPRSDGSILIADELYTAREMEKYHINLANVDPVRETPKHTYFCFGARFSTNPELHNFRALALG